MAARRPFWKWHRWKSIGFCLWPPSTCIWNLKLKFQSKLDLCSGNHVVYRQTDRRTDKVNPVYPPSNFVGRGYNEVPVILHVQYHDCSWCGHKRGLGISSHGTELVNLKYPGFGTREEVLEGSITTDCTQYDEHTQVHMESQKAPEGKIKWN